MREEVETNAEPTPGGCEIADNRATTQDLEPFLSSWE